MRAIVSGVIKDVQVTSVILSHDLTDTSGDHLYMFRCIRCGSPILQYMGFVVQILPGLAPVNLPIIIRCRNSSCKHYYSFQTIV